MVKFDSTKKAQINPVHYKLAELIMDQAIAYTKTILPADQHEEFFSMMSTVFNDMAEHVAKHLRPAMPC